MIARTPKCPFCGENANVYERPAYSPSKWSALLGLETPIPGICVIQCHTCVCSVHHETREGAENLWVQWVVRAARKIGEDAARYRAIRRDAVGGGGELLEAMSEYGQKHFADYSSPTADEFDAALDFARERVDK